MPLFTQIVYSNTGTQASVNVDPSIASFTLAIATSLSGTASYKLQFSLDGSDVSDANAIWFDSTGWPASSATSILGSVTFPIARIRAVIASLTGTLTLQVRQGFSAN